MITEATTIPFQLTEKQKECNSLASHPDLSYLLAYGGAGSAKTFNFVRNIFVRCLRHQGHTAAIFRQRYNHAITTLVHNTIPQVESKCFPQLKLRFNSKDGFYPFPGGSKLFVGGLDDKDRTDKILGSEFGTAMINECSQTGYIAFKTLKTRMRQKLPPGMLHKIYLDENPPKKGHWSYKVFRQGRDPETNLPLPNLESYSSIQMNPVDNKENLPEKYYYELESLTGASRLRFFEGEFGDDTEGALFSIENFEMNRELGALPEMLRVVVGIDPSGAKDAMDTSHDEIGIVVVGLGRDGRLYVLEDLSILAGPYQWASVAWEAVRRHGASAIVYEKNFGGAMVEQVLKSARPNDIDGIRILDVNASQGKVQRAEPFSALYAQGKIRHAGVFLKLEDEACGFTTRGYIGERSPNRMDAAIFAMAELFPAAIRKPEPFDPFNSLQGFQRHQQVVWGAM